MECRNSIHTKWGKWLIIGLLIICSCKVLPAQAIHSPLLIENIEPTIGNLRVGFSQKAKSMLNHLVSFSYSEFSETSRLRYNLFLFHENLKVYQKITGIRTISKSFPGKIETPATNNSIKNYTTKEASPEKNKEEKSLEEKNKAQFEIKKPKPKGIWNRAGNRKIRI
ncbi:MAG: hypothetical protein ACEPOZ_18455 [Marinifilaceae bacterium]